MAITSETNIMTKISDGEFTEAYEVYKKVLSSYVYKILKDPDETENVVHDTFRKLLKQDYSKIKDSLKQWLFIVARNQAIKFYNKRKRMVALSDDFEEELIDNSPSVFQNMIDSEVKTQLPKLLKVLTEKQKKAIRYKYYNDYSYKQIGKKLKIGEGNVGFQLNFAINAMRKEFAKINKKYGYR